MQIVQRVFSSLILAITLLGCLIGLQCVHVAQHIYPYAIPFVVATVTCCVVGVIAVSRNALAVCLTQNTLVVVASAILILAIKNWPGGDDGPGMILVGIGVLAFLPATILAIIASIVTLIFRCFEGAKIERNPDAERTSGEEVA
jgi:hypothetical protein